jgi:hypothetical protein
MTVQVIHGAQTRQETAVSQARRSPKTHTYPQPLDEDVCMDAMHAPTAVSPGRTVGDPYGDGPKNTEQTAGWRVANRKQAW